MLNSEIRDFLTSTHAKILLQILVEVSAQQQHNTKKTPKNASSTFLKSHPFSLQKNSPVFSLTPFKKNSKQNPSIQGHHETLWMQQTLQDFGGRRLPTTWHPT